ncbi:MAG: hypothetical protein KTR35_21025 [Gammaproteobacteria bacterium]|nr:hypothetical protein [Gammaproteobacteria bacterium]
MPSTTQKDIDKFLQSNGLIMGYIETHTLSVDLYNSMQVAAPNLSLEHALIVFANAGPQFWQKLKLATATDPELAHCDHPVDRFSEQVADDFACNYIDGIPHRLFPGGNPIALIGLGTHLGWSHPSPLGLTLHNQFGPWYAFRAVIACRINQISTPMKRFGPTEMQVSPCRSCSTKPCVSRCPAGAVSESRNFDVNACLNHRLIDGSECLADCPARRACPIGSDHVYDPKQLEYHMLRVLGRRSDIG